MLTETMIDFMVGRKRNSGLSFTIDISRPVVRQGESVEPKQHISGFAHSVFARIPNAPCPQMWFQNSDMPSEKDLLGIEVSRECKYSWFTTEIPRHIANDVVPTQLEMN